MKETTYPQKLRLSCATFPWLYETRAFKPAGWAILHSNQSRFHLRGSVYTAYLSMVGPKTLTCLGSITGRFKIALRSCIATGLSDTRTISTLDPCRH